MAGTIKLELLDRLKAKEDELASEFDIEHQREVYRWAAQRVQADVDSKTWEAFRMTHVDGVANECRNMLKA